MISERLNSWRDLARVFALRPCCRQAYEMPACAAGAQLVPVWVGPIGSGIVICARDDALRAWDVRHGAREAWSLSMTNERAAWAGQQHFEGLLAPGMSRHRRRRRPLPCVGKALRLACGPRRWAWHFRAARCVSSATIFTVTFAPSRASSLGHLSTNIVQFRVNHST